MAEKKRIIIIGAGPTGLATAYQLIKLKSADRYEVIIYEIDNQPGGISKTLTYKGYRFDLGGHRFFTKFPEINRFYHQFLGKEMLKRNRLSRIYYDNKFYNYPLSLINALNNLGALRSILILGSWIKRQIKPYNQEINFKQWVSNRFGDRLFEIFFKSYTEKVWGIPTTKLSADWAIQRIQNFNLLKAVANAVFKTTGGAKTIISWFYYPKYGPGKLYDQLVKKLTKQNVKIKFRHELSELEIKNNRVIRVKLINLANKTSFWEKADYLISTMPLNQLAIKLKLTNKIKDLKQLSFRGFITVNLIVKANPFPDQWIYIHDPKVKVGRIQNFRNWSPYMVKPGGKQTPIALEYFASENDNLWRQSDQKLIKLASQELTKIGLIKKEEIVDGFVYRIRNAYPVYKMGYKKIVDQIKNNLQRFKNVYPCGRGGLFRYNNQDHSMLTGFMVAKNIIADNHHLDVWQVNDSNEYLETK